MPEFIIELKSTSDRVADLQEKMQKWRRNGVILGWLIHPDQQFRLIYRAGVSESEIVRESSVAGDGPVEGFKLDLKPIWQGLDQEA